MISYHITFLINKYEGTKVRGSIKHKKKFLLKNELHMGNLDDMLPLSAHRPSFIYGDKKIALG